MMLGLLSQLHLSIGECSEISYSRKEPLRNSVWNNTFTNIENYGNGGIGLPWSAVLDASSMEYKWCDYAGEGTLDSNIQALIAQ